MQEIPRWMPTYVSPLCYGEEWEADRPGHFMLAARFSRLATGPITRQSGRWNEDLTWWCQESTLPIEAGEFVGRLRVATKSMAVSGRLEYLGVWLTATAVPRVSGPTPGRPGAVEPRSFQLPIADPEKFHRAIWELTRPVSGTPPLREPWKGHS